MRVAPCFVIQNAQLVEQGKEMSSRGWRPEGGFREWGQGLWKSEAINTASIILR